MYKIYLVEDDLTLGNHIKYFLEKYDFEVLLVNDFKSIVEEFNELNPDLVLMDIQLPYYDGFYFCRTIRQTSNTPIIFVSATTDDIQQIMAIELGGDDYITKPISLPLLLSKINGFLRRVYGEYGTSLIEDSLSVNSLSLNDKTFSMTYKDTVSELSKNEFKLLKKLMLHPDEVVSREELLTVLWDDEAFVDDNTLTVNVTRVKNRLKAINLMDVIKTKRGVGYILESKKL